MKVALVSVDYGVDPGARMLVPAIRIDAFARELARLGHEVVVVAPTPPEAPDDVVRVGLEALEHSVFGADRVVAYRLPTGLASRLGGLGTPVVYDLFVPYLAEHLSALALGRLTVADRRLLRLAAVDQLRSIAAGGAFVCPSERARDFWLGLLGGVGRLDPETYARDPSLRSLIDVVPLGIPERPPRPARPVLKGVVRGIDARDAVLLWAGGIWDWLDPLTVIRAVAGVASRRDDVRLFFLGGERSAMTETATALARQLGLLGRVVFFNEGCVAYEERAGYLLEADLGVCAHLDSLEARFAFRTRLLDHFWAGLPTITTRGDELGELVGRRGLGRALPAGDVEGWEGAIEQLLDDEDERERIRANLAAVREELAWPRVLEPLAGLLEHARPAPAAPTTRLRLQELALRARISLSLGGPQGALGRQAGKLAAHLRAPWP